MTIHDVKIEFQQILAKNYEPKEIQSIFELIAEDLDFSRTDIVVFRDKELSDKQIAYFEDCLKRLETFEPVQYVRGKADFYDLQFSVDSSVLIPRQETEELVDLIIRENQNLDGKIVDLGTGSGCIAISLAKNLQKSSVFAVDISKNALSVAEKNAKQNDVTVTFCNGDMREESFMKQFSEIDIIVSNPPYVCDSEKSEMRSNVLNYEPHLALFVKDENPLEFYEAIAVFGSKNLKNGGKVYCEINETLGNETKQLFERYGFSQCKIVKDLFGKDRIVRAIK